MHRTFHRPDGSQSLIKAVHADLRARRLPHVSTKCPGSWEAVAAGRHDGWLKYLRRQLAAVDRPVFLTFHHEPENDSFAPRQSAEDFVAMQTRIIELFARRAPKVTIVPILQSWTLDPGNKSARPASWNVAAARVFGIDIYNPFCEANHEWVSFETKLRRARKMAGDRPIAVGEYGCRNDPANPGRASEWMRDAFNVARDGNVVSMSYFHSGVNSPDGAWHLDGGRATVFRNRLSAPAVARLRG
jgi:hypothetical protein